MKKLNTLFLLLFISSFSVINSLKASPNFSGSSISKNLSNVTVKQSELASFFNVYSNPASDRVIIKRTVASNETVFVKVYNSKGDQLFEDKVYMNNGTSSIELSKLTAGKYTFKITSGIDTYTLPFIKL